MRRVRSRLRGTADRPRLSVFRSLRHMYAQLIDDVNARTLLAVDDRMLASGTRKKSEGKREKEAVAYLVGKELGERARKAGIHAARFDRGRYQYHGRVAQVAEGVRASGVRF